MAIGGGAIISPFNISKLSEIKLDRIITYKPLLGIFIGAGSTVASFTCSTLLDKQNSNTKEVNKKTSQLLLNITKSIGAMVGGLVAVLCAVD